MSGASSAFRWADMEDMWNDGILPSGRVAGNWVDRWILPHTLHGTGICAYIDPPWHHPNGAAYMAAPWSVWVCRVRCPLLLCSGHRTLTGTTGHEVSEGCPQRKLQLYLPSDESSPSQGLRHRNFRALWPFPRSYLLVKNLKNANGPWQCYTCYSYTTSRIPSFLAPHALHISPQPSRPTNRRSPRVHFRRPGHVRARSLDDEQPANRSGGLFLVPSKRLLLVISKTLVYSAQGNIGISLGKLK